MTYSKPLPRHQELQTFNPHRDEFTCKFQADSVPPIDADAEAWSQEALHLTRFGLWPNKKDWRTAEALWIKASERKHWKAMLNLASLYEKGMGEGGFKVEANPYLAVEIVENAMMLGIPAAYEKMGYYHYRAIGGIRLNASRAWAFWQMASDLGNPDAQTRIGKSILGTYDNPEGGFWANRKVGLKMLECAVAQGYGDAAYELGSNLDVFTELFGGDYQTALDILQLGAKLGSEGAASRLAVSFHRGTDLVANFVDKQRSERYSQLADALYHNPDLRFPNLDKILPLPPAELPYWDGKRESLVEAAKPMRAVNDRPLSSESRRTGRHHIPDHLRLTPDIVTDPSEGRVTSLCILLDTAARGVPHTGYWTIQSGGNSMDLQLNMQQMPQYLRRGETFPEYRQHPFNEDAYWNFHGLGSPVPHSQPRTPAARGLVRIVDRPAWAQGPACNAGKTCPASGIWYPEPAEDHPHIKLIDPYRHQCFLQAGTPMPDAHRWGLPAGGRIRWHLLEAAA